MCLVEIAHSSSYICVSYCCPLSWQDYNKEENTCLCVMCMVCDVFVCVFSPNALVFTQTVEYTLL